MERPGLLFEESRDLWVAHTTLIRLDMADYQNGAFSFHGLQPHWPSSQDRCDDLALLHDRHEAGREGDEAIDVDAEQSDSGIPGGALD